MSKQQYTRKGQRITQHWHINDDGERVQKDSHTDYDSINKAKRVSRQIQHLKDGALGMGVLATQ